MADALGQGTAIDFRLVDVFGTTPFSGNPLAVIGDGTAFDTETMQRITRWFNLSETTFLLPATDPAADYRVRIFSLGGELPFAGHPTLGSCHAWREAGGKPRRDDVVIQQCAAGLIEVRTSGEQTAFAAPPLLRSGPPSEEELDRALAALGLPRAAVVEARWIDNGPGWLGLLLRSAADVRAVRAARSSDQPLNLGFFGPCDAGEGADIEVRAIFDDGTGTLIEDPATGSLNAAIGQWLFGSGRAKGRYVAAQGGNLGRSARIEVSEDDSGQVWVAGRTETIAAGRLSDAVRTKP